MPVCGKKIYDWEMLEEVCRGEGDERGKKGSRVGEVRGTVRVR